MRGSGRSTTPISVILSDPAEHTLLPGVREPRRDEAQEDEHLTQSDGSVALGGENRRPREQEDRVLREDDVVEGEDEVAVVVPRPPFSYGAVSAFVRRELLRGRPGRALRPVGQLPAADVQ